MRRINWIKIHMVDELPHHHPFRAPNLASQYEKPCISDMLGNFSINHVWRYFWFWHCFINLWSINCPKKCIFYNFVLTSARNLGLLKQFTYMHLKVLITLFQKMVWFTGVQATAHEIYAIKISKKMMTQLKFNKIFQFQILIFPKQ